MEKITKIVAREVLDSRGDPTVEADVFLGSGAHAWAQVPSGASTGLHEALELRDGDPQRFGGKGVLKAVSHINTEIAKTIVGMDVTAQKEIDERMMTIDGTENKSRLGANAILAVSKAVCRAGAIASGVPLYQYISDTFKVQSSKFKVPIPMFNVINGGEHSDSGLSIQEYKVIPQGLPTFALQYRAGSEIYHALRKVLESQRLTVSVGDEGGFAPRLENNAQPLELIAQAAHKAGYAMGEKIVIGIDAAANYFYNKEEQHYMFALEKAKISRESLITTYVEWAEKFHVVSVEDGLQEEDWEGWRLMNEKIGTRIMIIGDDLLVTNVKRLQKAIREKACNAVLIKPNQIGTVSETIACMDLAKKHMMKTIVSHRSGETADDFIADLAVGTGADYIKTGAPCRGERIAKYNRLLRIEEDLLK